MVSSLLPPLSTQVEIVDKDGKPTPQFARILQKLALGSGLDVSNGVIDFATIAAKTILANKTAGTAAPTACSIDDILDFIAGTPTQGDILFRGASGWKRLPAGTAGKVLQTNGASADPTWVTPSSGGGGTVEAYKFSTSTNTVVSSAPTIATQVCSVTIAASGIARTFMVNGMISWNSGTHGMRGSVMRDGVRIWPSPSSPANNAINSNTNGDGAYFLMFCGVLVTIPGDNTTHTIGLAWEAQASTGGLTIQEQTLCAIKVA
jgi:hypothetical protein